MTAPPESPLRALPVEFVGSFPDPRVRLEPPLPEVAFVGRSNVGKSSLINALLGRRALARVSTTPGKTTLANIYRLPEFYLVDLPGYGFARAGRSAREGYRRLVRGYLRGRETVHGVAWLLDIRHQPSDDDLDMQELLAETGQPVLPVLTKADKLTRSARQQRIRDIASALGLHDELLQPTSSTTGDGIVDLARSIIAAARGGETK